MKIVFDCNVLVNAFIFKSEPARQSWEKVIKTGLVIGSLDIFDEYKRVFAHEKFDKYVKLETRLEFLLDIQKPIEFIPVSHKVNACRDSKDDMYLELTLSGKADCLITSDKDLLTLHPFENIPIISPKEFLDRF